MTKKQIGTAYPREIEKRIREIHKKDSRYTYLADIVREAVAQWVERYDGALPDGDKSSPSDLFTRVNSLEIATRSLADKVESIERSVSILNERH